MRVRGLVLLSLQNRKAHNEVRGELFGHSIFNPRTALCSSKKQRKKETDALAWSDDGTWECYEDCLESFWKDGTFELLTCSCVLDVLFTFESLVVVCSKIEKSNF
jgi:hypothetical protein